MQTRKRVLINAFTVRALRDTFPPARSAGMQPFFSLLRGYHIISLFLSKRGCNSVLFPLAGILALTVTSSYYDMTEIATRILPNVAVLTIDPDRYLLCFVALEI